MGHAYRYCCKASSILSLASISCFAPLTAQNDDTQTNQVVPIPGPQAYSEPHPVDAIVTDSQGHMHEETYTYYPNYYPQDAQHPDPNVVIINNTQQVTTQQNGYDNTSPSLFFPGFALGFIFASGFWCNYNGYYWNGYGYGRTHYRNWNNHWNNYWNRDWNNRWNDHWNHYHNNPNWRYRNNQHWNDQTGREWRQGGGERGGGERGGGRAGGGGHGGGRR